MSRKKKFALLLGLVLVVVDVIFCSVIGKAYHSVLLPILFTVLILGVPAFIVFGIKLFNKVIRKTSWYQSMFVDPNHEIFPDNTWYRKHDERNYDIVNLGSSGGKWAFDYSDTGVKGMNWAIQPQTLYEDYELLRHYHSILRKGGYVIITIMPFTGLNKKTGMMDAMKYVNFDIQGEPIQPYMFEMAQLYAHHPILFKKPAIKAFIKYLLDRDKPIVKSPTSQFDYNPMDEEQLKADAAMWVNGWKHQFAISDFDAPLTEENRKGREYRINLMRELIDFCTARGYHPVYVIPPVTQYLDSYFTPKFKETYYYSYLKAVDRPVPLLDYSANKDLMSSTLYFNSFFLNLRGRRLFTKQVLKDLGLMQQ